MVMIAVAWSKCHQKLAWLCAYFVCLTYERMCMRLLVRTAGMPVSFPTQPGDEHAIKQGGSGPGLRDL